MGIKLSGASIVNSLLGNYVGTDSSGTIAVRNEYAGIWVEDDASDNLIGGKEAGAGNLISGNYSYGLLIAGHNARRNIVQGNRVGTDVSGGNGIKNAIGIEILSASENTIGGSLAGQGNLISGNDQGLVIGAPDFSATDNKVQGNLIGTDVAGSGRLPNTYGVSISYTPGNLIGGPNPGEGNVISGNSNVGVAIAYERAAGNVVQGNLIGTDITGKINLGNGASGVEILEAPGNVVGGSGSQSGNVIGGNGWGVVIHGAYATANGVQGNRIGVDSAGNPLPNISHGVFIYDRASGNLVGGTDAGMPNTIASNGGDGVRVENASTGNALRANSIHDNSGKGIDNVAGGNNELTPPTVRSTGPASGTACPSCTVDVFSDDADEGRTYHGSVTAEASGNWSFPGAVSGPNVTATATDNSGNTSEFSVPFLKGIHDAAALKISLPNEGGSSTPIDVRVQNLGDHSESIGVYADVTPPGGPSNPYGCAPSGRVLATTVTVAPGKKTAVSSASLSFACANAAGAHGKAFTIVAVADAHADDAAACGPGQLQSMPCYNALASDDSNPSNNRMTRSCCKAGQ
jgi:titin